jgi:adenylate cyclase
LQARKQTAQKSGDSVLAVFDSTVSALRAAIAIQERLGGASIEAVMRFRIGIHLGDLIEKADGTVYGDGVNVAARLQALADPGGIVVSDAVRSAVRGRLPSGFEDRGTHRIKNHPDAVRVFALARKQPSVAQDGLDRLEEPPSEPQLPEKPSVAVLAFVNLSGDPEQEYFTDGVTEDIITELSRFSSLFVIARNSSFSYKGQNKDVKEIGLELGVRYVVEGSIRRLGERIRVAAQLIDSQTGNHVWAERYDRALGDIFAVQEEVTECIVGAIAPNIEVAEQARARQRPKNVTSYQMAVKAAELVSTAWKTTSAADLARGLALAREALVADPDSVLAMETVARARWQGIALGPATQREEEWREGIEAADRAILEARSSSAHALKALLLAYASNGGRWEEALIECRTAIQINPQDSYAVIIAAHLISNGGDARSAFPLLERLLRINPRDPYAYNTHAQIALCHFYVREYTNGIEWALKAIGALPRYLNAHLILTALYVGVGDLDKAGREFEIARGIAPLLVEDRVLKGRLYAMREGEYRQRYVSFLRTAAGLDGAPQPNATC